MKNGEKMRKTKIVATLGPATNNYKALKSIIQNGANVIRINFSHGNVEQHQESIDLIKQIRNELNTPVAIMIDTRGPEVRIKTFQDGCGILKRNSLFTNTYADNRLWSVRLFDIGAVREIKRKRTVSADSFHSHKAGTCRHGDVFCEINFSRIFFCSNVVICQFFSVLIVNGKLHLMDI